MRTDSDAARCYAVLLRLNEAAAVRDAGLKDIADLADVWRKKHGQKPAPKPPTHDAEFDYPPNI